MNYVHPQRCPLYGPSSRSASANHPTDKRKPAPCACPGEPFSPSCTSSQRGIRPNSYSVVEYSLDHRRTPFWYKFVEKATVTQVFYHAAPLLPHEIVKYRPAMDTCPRFGDWPQFLDDSLNSHRDSSMKTNFCGLDTNEARIKYILESDFLQ